MATYYQIQPVSSGESKMAQHASLVKYDPYLLWEGKVTLTDPIFRVKKGAEKVDLLQTEIPGVFLCSQKLVSMLTEAQVTGWSATPVVLEVKKERIPEPFYFFNVYGKCAPFDYSKSEIINHDIISMPELKGRYFDEHSVNTDIFVVDKTLMTFVNEKLYLVLKQQPLKNLRFTANDQIISMVSAQLLKK